MGRLIRVLFLFLGLGLLALATQIDLMKVKTIWRIWGGLSADFPPIYCGLLL